jgi:hypothetical protein
MKRAYVVVAIVFASWGCGGSNANDTGSAGSTGGGTTSAGGSSQGGMGQGGATGGTGGSSTGMGGSDPSSMEIVVAVGWQGLRLVSIDEGQSWCETGLMVDPHDDLFRGAGYHDGLFVGAHAGLVNSGAIWVSDNGFDWSARHQTNEEPNLPENPSGQWYGGAAYGNGIWMAAGGCGRMATSSDGLTWTEVERFTDGCVHIRSLAFADGQFVAALDDDDWYASSDGVNWSLHSSGAGSFVVALESGLSGPIDGDRFYQGRGVCLAGIGSPDYGISRSTASDCSDAMRVADTTHRPTTFLFGRAPIADFERAQTGDTLADCLGLP